MRKLVVLCLAICMVFVMSTNGLAHEKNQNSFELKGSKDTETVNFMKKFNNAASGMTMHSTIPNSLKVAVTDTKPDGNKVKISGTGTVCLDGAEYSFEFKDEIFFELQIGQQQMYDGAIDISMYNGVQKQAAILDMTATSDFQKVVASISLVDDNEETKGIYFFGESFKEQETLINQYQSQMAKVKEISDEQCKEESIAENEPVTTASSSSKFHHVSNKSNKVLDSKETEKQMVVMSIAQYDPRSKGEESGSELVRVFSRSYNVCNYVDNAVEATPYRVKSSFSCGKSTNGSPFLKIDCTLPQNGSSVMSRVISLMSAYIPNQIAQTLVEISMKYDAFESTSVKLSDHLNTGTDTKASFNVLVYNRLHPEKSGYINLPKATASSDAELNKTNGVAFVTEYRELSVAGNNSTATATCTASIEYRMLLSGASQFATISTGTATYSHKLYSKN